MDLPIGPTNLSNTAALNRQQHLDQTTTNYNALIANNLPLQQLLANRLPDSSCSLAMAAAAAFAYQHQQLQQQAAHLQHHQQQQPSSHLPAVNLSTGQPQRQQQPLQPQQQQQQQAPPPASFQTAAQQSSAQTRMAQAAPPPPPPPTLQSYPSPVSYNLYPTQPPPTQQQPLQPQQQHGSVIQQTSNPVPQQRQPQPQPQQQQPQTTTVPLLPSFYPLDQALALLAQPNVASNIFTAFQQFLHIANTRTNPHHTHHHHHSPYHYHHHLHGSHHHHHHHYGPHGQNNGQDDAMLTINESKPRGLNRAEIDSLPPYIQMNEKDSRTCVICLSRFEPKSKIRPLPCNHAFHAKCVDKWLRANRTCPICRRDALKPHVAKIKRI